MNRRHWNAIKMARECLEKKGYRESKQKRYFVSEVKRGKTGPTGYTPDLSYEKSKKLVIIEVEGLSGISTSKIIEDLVLCTALSKDLIAKGMKIKLIIIISDKDYLERWCELLAKRFPNIKRFWRKNVKVIDAGWQEKSGQKSIRRQLPKYL